MSDNSYLTKEDIENRLLEAKGKIRRISRGKKKKKFQLPQVGRTEAQLKSFGLISRGARDVGHIDDSLNLKYLDDFYDIISSHPAWQEKAKGAGLFLRIKSIFSRPLLRRLTSSLLSEQREFNSHLVRFLNQLSNHLDSRDDLVADKLMEVEKKFDELINEIINRVLVIRNQEMVERIDILFSKLDQEILNLDVLQGEFERDLDKIKRGQEKIYESLNQINQNLLLQRRELAGLSVQLAQREASTSDGREVGVSAALDSEDYLKFEDIFRGPSQEIAAKQSCYLPYFKNCKRVLDIGCGKGDFLQLLKDNGIGAYGVDSNQEMVSFCQRQGLEVLQAEGLEYLQSLDDERLDGLFACQFIEHLPVDKFKDFIQLGYRKLKPGCSMVVETVNPACLYAFLNTFLLDLTHSKPIHPLALKFLFQLAGFKKVDMLFLSPIPAEMKLKEISIPPKTDIKLKRWLATFNRNVDRVNKLFLAPQEYAVIGKKQSKARDEQTE